MCSSSSPYSYPPWSTTTAQGGLAGNTQAFSFISAQTCRLTKCEMCVFEFRQGIDEGFVPCRDYVLTGHIMQTKAMWLFCAIWGMSFESCLDPSYHCLASVSYVTVSNIIEVLAKFIDWWLSTRTLVQPLEILFCTSTCMGDTHMKLHINKVCSWNISYLTIVDTLSI